MFPPAGASACSSGPREECLGHVARCPGKRSARDFFKRSFAARNDFDWRSSARLAAGDRVAEALSSAAVTASAAFLRNRELRRIERNSSNGATRADQHRSVDCINQTRELLKDARLSRVALSTLGMLPPHSRNKATAMVVVFCMVYRG